MQEQEREIISLLREYKMKRAAVETMRRSLALLRLDRATPREELAEQRRELRCRASRCAAEVGALERALELLSCEERAVIDGFFITPPERFQCWDVLCENLGYERSKIYRLRKTALRKLTMSMFGAATPPSASRRA